MPQTSVFLLVLRSAGTAAKFIFDDGYSAVLPFFPPLLIRLRPFWKDNVKRETDSLYDALTLTEAADYVLDCKSESSVFSAG
jgi:hypothetical protein